MFIAVSAVMVAAIPEVQAQSPSGEPLYAQASVDNATPYLGQQITYSFRLYQRAGVTLDSRSVRYEPPNFAGFWNTGETAQDSYTENIGTREYHVVELRTVLFPSVVGTIAIDAAVLEVSTGAAGTSSRLESPSVAVDVRPLPAGAPASFTGGVGRFEISASAGAATARVNDPVHLTVSVSGEGNIEALPDPDWPEFAGWRVIESPVQFDSRVVAGQVTGSRIYEIALVPEAAGEFTIPEIPYPHFNPDLEQYVQAAAAPMDVSVAGVDDTPPVPPVLADAATDEEGEEMRPIKPVPTSLRLAGTGLTGNLAYWGAWALPLFAILGAVAWRRRQAAREATLAEDLRRNARARAQSAFARDMSSGRDLRIAAAGAVRLFLADRLGTSSGGLTRDELSRRLRDAGAQPDLVHRVSDVLSAGEVANFTPADPTSGGHGEYIGRVTQLLIDLEAAMDP